MTTISKTAEIGRTESNMSIQTIVRRLPTLMIVIAAALLIGSAFVLYSTIDDVFWEMHLDAPQYDYRGGLDIVIYIDRIQGKDADFDDLREINELNHYIGMRSLDDAAILEREIAIPALKVSSALLVISGIYILLQHAAFHYAPKDLTNLSKPLRFFGWFFRLRELKFLPWLFVFPALLFPVFFLLDLYYWLENSGQNLDLTAPFSSSIHPFTPTMRGEGKIGQFHTVSDMADGWFTAANVSVIILVALILGIVHASILQYRAYKQRQASEVVVDNASTS